MVLNSNWQYIHTFYCIQENCCQYAGFSFDLLFEVHNDQYRIRRRNGDLFFVIQKKIHLEKNYGPSGWLSYPFIELICV